MLIASDSGGGKCLGKGTPILLYSGDIIPVEEVRVNDLLMGPDSNPRRVLSLSKGRGELFRIIPKKGDPWTCNDIHVLTLKGSGRKKGQILDIPLDEYLQRAAPMPGNIMSLFSQQWKLFSVPIEWPAESEDAQRHRFDPYVMGLWLGDGRFDRPEIHCPDQEVISYLLSVDFGDLTPHHYTPSEKCDYVALTGWPGHLNWFTNYIQTFIRDGEKRIRRDYLLSSREERLQLLAGIIDTDGYHSSGYFEVTSQYKGLAEDIKFLARSLGFRVTHAIKEVLYNGEWRSYQRLNIIGNIDEIPLKIERKKAEPKDPKDPQDTGFEAVAIGEGEYYGFALDSDGRFLLGDFTVTHNTGGFISLLLDGYKLRLINLDPAEKINILLHLLHHPKSPYYVAAQKLNLNEAFRYETLNHKMITIEDGKRVRIQPSAAVVWPRLEKMVHEWREACGVYLGQITSWGPDTILAIDTFTFAGFAALFYIQELNNQLHISSGNAWRRNMGDAQAEMDKILKFVCSDAVKCHVIICTHINYLTEDYQKEDGGGGTSRQKLVISSSASEIFGADRSYPTAIGRALGPRIGGYFSDVLEMKIEGSGRNQRRLYYTIPTGTIAVKTSAPYALEPTYDIRTGLADIFAAIRGTRPNQTAKPPTKDS